MTEPAQGWGAELDARRRYERRPHRWHARPFAVLPPSRSYGRWSARLRRWRVMQRAAHAAAYDRGEK